MNTFFPRVFHPLFSWAFMVFYGLDSIHKGLFPLVFIVFLGLAGLSQVFWRARLKGQQPYAKGDLIAFGLGILPVFIFPLVVAWEFWIK
jgi:hypothetical protein